MGGGASSYSMQPTGVSSPEAPLWLAASSHKVLPLTMENFSFVKPIGKGKFGLVYLSRHSTAKHVAVKYIPMKIIQECDCGIRLQQEISVLQRIDHPFVVHCFGGFNTPACIALVFEYAFGGELYTRMKQASSMSEAHAKFYFCEIALALDYLHNKLKVVYRDLKPENILIDWKGHVKLCDFGFAVPLGLTIDENLRDNVGTAMYVAPEIAGGKRTGGHSFQVDWWSLGCVLYEMTVGRAPFGDTDHMSKFEIFNNINEKQPSIPLLMSSSLSNLIRGLLQKEPEKRSDWNAVKSSAWVSDVDWTALAELKIQPPWIPPAAQEPSCAHFVKWETKDVDVPSSTTPEALTYCKDIVLPKPKFKEPEGGGTSSPMIRSPSIRDKRQPSIKNMNTIGKSTSFRGNAGPK